MRRPRRFNAQMNVVPYIDVMLVLLIIFMVSAPLMQTGVVELPSVGQASTAQQGVPLQVVVGREGALELRDGGDVRPVSLEEAVARAVDAPERPVVIAADRQVRYEAVMAVMDAMQRAGVSRLGLLVETPGS